MTTKKTEEKAAAAVKPVAEKIDPNPVDVRDPYPTGKGRDPEADFEAAHGYRRAKE